MIVVCGSINMDLVVHTPRFLAPGETRLGSTFITNPGGKGANQAVACALLGAETRMIGCLGDDDFGAALRHGLDQAGVDTHAVMTLDQTASGVALITVNDQGENTIIVVPGANECLTMDTHPNVDALLAQAKILLLQLEIPMTTVIAMAQKAHDLGVCVMLDPAPTQPLTDALYALIDILTPNQTEIETLVGFPVTTEAERTRAARHLLDKGMGKVIIKLGAEGVYWADRDGSGSHAAFPVNVVDTVAAGDAFNGGLAVALSEDQPFAEALHWGLAAGALAVTRRGAQSAMPTRADLLAFLAQQRE